MVPPNKLPKWLGRTMGMEMVTLLVGSTPQKFAIHKKLICQVDYFHKAFTSDTNEALSGKMNLPNEDGDAINVFVDWLYRRTVPRIPLEDGDKTLKSYFHLYMFAEEKKLYGLSNMVMDSIQRNPVDVANEADIILSVAGDIYTRTSADSPLRRFSVHSLVTAFWQDDTTPSIKRENLERIWSTCAKHPEFFQDLFTHYTSFSRRHPPPEPWKMYNDDICFFHRHAEADRCQHKPEEERKQQSRR